MPHISRVLGRLRSWITQHRAQISTVVKVACVFLALWLAATISLGLWLQSPISRPTSTSPARSQMSAPPTVTSTEPNSDPGYPQAQPPALYIFTSQWGAETERETTPFAVQTSWYASWSCSGIDAYGACSIQIIEDEGDGAYNRLYLSPVEQSDGTIYTAPLTLPGRYVIVAYGDGTPSDNITITIYPEVPAD